MDEIAALDATLEVIRRSDIERARLQAHTRQLRGMLSDLGEETGCERITGLGPTIAVQQGIIRQSNPRSSVGTRSGIFTYLRLLFSSAGQCPCPVCGAP